MSRDYRPPVKRAAEKSGHPLLTGIFIGLFIGLAIALGVALMIRNGPSPFVEPPRADTPPAPKAEAKPAAPAAGPAQANGTVGADGKPRFDFYKILPGVEEPVTEQEIKKAGGEVTANPGEFYFLQAGSFQSAADADNLKAKLALMGVEAGIQTATLPDKGVWHRVRVGPFTTIEDINRARQTLAQNGIEANLVKIRDNLAPR